MAQFLSPPLFQASDASANPLVGAKEYIYQTNTTTLLSLFSDEALTTPIANPMVSDSAGVFPICFIAETKFKVILKSSADVTLYTRDPVYSTGQADNVLASNVSFDGTGIGFSSTNVQAAIVELYGSVAQLSGADFLGPVTVTKNATGAFFQAVSTDDGASAGPSFETYRNSASPAGADILGEYLFYGKNSTDVKTLYAAIRGVLLDVVNATEDGEIILRTIAAGALGDRLHIRRGAYMDGAVGGDLGVGTINAIALYQQGVAVPFSKSFESAQQTITAAGALTIAHGLGVQPKIIAAALKCITADQGYSIGDELQISNGLQAGGAFGQGLSIVPDATNLNVRFGSHGNVIDILNKGTGDVTGISNTTRWQLIVRAWV